MNEEIKKKLIEWANLYHTKEFINNDPVQFPHRFSEKKDIEISGLLTAIMSFGNRKQILKKAEELHCIMNNKPFEYVMSLEWNNDFRPENKNSFYRMLSYSDFNSYFRILYNIYSEYLSLEDAMLKEKGNPMERLCSIMAVSSKSPQKKLNMFLRWMIRKNSEVDFGIWTKFNTADLIIPMDTHVCRVAHELGLTESTTFSLKNAVIITNALKQVFPEDPCMGDFALFGSGVQKKDNQ